MPYAVVRRQTAEAVDGDATPFIIEESIAHLMTLGARLFARALQEHFTEQGVSVGQWSMLLFLWEEDGLTQKELSRRMHIEEPTVARTVDRMERDQLVTRHRDADDRRKIHVRLTDRGRELRDDLIPFAQEVNGRATRGLSEQEKERINSLLSYVVARLS